MNPINYDPLGDVEWKHRHNLAEQERMKELQQELKYEKVGDATPVPMTPEDYKKLYWNGESNSVEDLTK